MNRLKELVEVDDSLVVRDFRRSAAAMALEGTEILVTGWGCPQPDAEVLAAAPRLRAVPHAAGSIRSLVTEGCWERGLPADSPLFTLPNVLLTPHIAGSQGNELERLGRTVVEEVEPLVEGLPLQHQILLADLERVA
ncbi:hypothetical protein [Streptacidiphilus carbonis]|jgi:phosphoglycerate dehydrogenase-like enzyme|uniref:hypothetical protein n=1 Tax=Streptacidiphilus carbonis TaxID=105422 RepID=UPI0005A7CD82|nr:hypothetical protein [Streptacidiphilus carbonis]